MYYFININLRTKYCVGSHGQIFIVLIFIDRIALDQNVNINV